MYELEYPGIGIHKTAHIELLEVPIKLDISTGDVITPKEIKYS